MGAFFLVNRRDSESRDQQIIALQQLALRQGFETPHSVSTSTFSLHIYPKLTSPGVNFVQRPNGDFCACTGTFLYSGTVGETALSSFLHDFSPQTFNDDEMRGDFCLFASVQGQTYVFVARPGIYKVYRTIDHTVWSSSLLLAVAGATDVTLDEQACHEYVFDGASYGGDTVVRDVKQLEGGRLYPLDGHESTAASESIPVSPGPASFTDSADRCMSELRSHFSIISGCFGNRIEAALSGGYDSRLLLGLLMERGVMPDLHVYGGPDTDDVRIAKQIAAGENIPLQHINKSLSPDIDPDEFPDVVQRNFHVFDGLPIEGVFRDAVELRSRIDRAASGKIYLNGGGGEIFRHFYYLPNRPHRVADFVSAYHSRYSPKSCTGSFSEAEYVRRLGEKVQTTLATSADRLSRPQIELLYPHFRCRFWMGSNNSIDNRFGYSLTPFIDHRIIAAAIAIPAEYKCFGALEAELIRRASPTLAAYPSVYGHAFDGPPPLRRKMKDLRVYARPVLLRRYAFRIKSFGRTAVRRYTTSDRFLQSVLPGGFQRVSGRFDPDRFSDLQQFNRLATLEYFLRQIDAGL